MEAIERDDHKYPLSDFGKPPAGLGTTELIFESRYGSSKQNE